MSPKHYRAIIFTNKISAPKILIIIYGLGESGSVGTLLLGLGESGSVGTLLFGLGESGSVGTLLFGLGESGSVGTFEAYDIAKSAAITNNTVIIIDLNRFNIISLLIF
jgi:hypothetical protein